LHSISGYLAKKGVGVLEMDVREPSLEDVFINLTKGGD